MILAALNHKVAAVESHFHQTFDSAKNKQLFKILLWWTLTNSHSFGWVKVKYQWSLELGMTAPYPLITVIHKVMVVQWYSILNLLAEMQQESLEVFVRPVSVCMLLCLCFHVLSLSLCSPIFVCFVCLSDLFKPQTVPWVLQTLSNKWARCWNKRLLLAAWWKNETSLPYCRHKLKKNSEGLQRTATTPH